MRAARINTLLDRSGSRAVEASNADSGGSAVNIHGVRMRDVRPGEFWWADFPFEQEPGQSKRRPCLVLSHNRDGTIEVCYVTSQNHVFARHGAYQLLPRTVTGLGKESYVRLDRSFALEPDRFLRYDTHCERPLFEWVGVQIARSATSSRTPTPTPPIGSFRFTVEHFHQTALLYHSQAVEAARDLASLPQRVYTVDANAGIRTAIQVSPPEFERYLVENDGFTEDGHLALPPAARFPDLVQTVFWRVQAVAAIHVAELGNRSPEAVAELGRLGIEMTDAPLTPPMVTTNAVFPSGAYASLVASRKYMTQDGLVTFGDPELANMGDPVELAGRLWLAHALFYDNDKMARQRDETVANSNDAN